MFQARLFVVILGITLVAGLVGPAASAEYRYVPVGLVEIESAEIAANLEVLRDVRGDGLISLAARGPDISLLYVKQGGLDLLRNLGIEFDVLLEDATSMEIYRIPRQEESPAPGWLQSITLTQTGLHLIVGVEAGAALDIHMLPFKQRLPLPHEDGLPLEIEARAAPRTFAQPLTYEPLIQDMVDSVSQSRLYSTLSDLTGENSVVIGGETHTISTRYSPTFYCRRAGQYILERFQELGLVAEYDYFNFRTQMRAISFPVDNQRGWAAGKGMLILYTENGGLLWDVQYNGETLALNDIVMVDTAHGCVVGNDGTVLLTQNGTDWQTVSTPTSNDLNSVFFVDASTAYCCGMNGTILRSLDGGSNWTSLSSGTSRDLYGICFVDANTGWVVGESGHIRKTQNGGSSWSSVSSPTSADLMDVTFQGGTDGWACGTSGTMVKTDDGAAWQIVSTPISNALNSIYFITDQVGWSCGVDGALIKSWDGGSTWINQGSGVYVNLKDVRFLSPNEGWLAGLGQIRHSVNGGLEWDDQSDSIRAGDYNVVGTKLGTTNPDEIYVICGHYDCTSPTASTYAPGADDNGTGTVSVIEAARVLDNYDFEATVRFVCFSREEQGLVGSSAYVREAYNRGDSILAALNFDMIGYEDMHPENANIICNPPSQWLGDEYEDAVALYVPGLSIHRQTMTYVGSDNTSFWDYGYASFCGIEDSPLNNPYYHRTTDRVNTIDFDFYTDVVRGGVATLAQLARVDDGTSSVAQATEPALLKVSPNPGSGKIAFEVRDDGNAPASFEIYDVNGRLVRGIQPVEDGGVTRATWHGTDAGGTRVGPGIYFVKISGRTEATKVVLLK